MEDYRTIRGTAVGEYEEKKSRFIAQLSFADSEEAAVAFLEQVRAANRTARHNVYAYRLREGNRERYSDDGEPAKTAGTPALEVLQHSGLTDLIVVITRYFGGVLLGTGGLVRAYTTATARALENAEVVTVRSVVELRVTVDYSLYERASLLIDAAGAKQAAPGFPVERGEKNQKKGGDQHGCAPENRRDRTPDLCTVGDLQRCQPRPGGAGAAGSAAPGVSA